MLAKPEYSSPPDEVCCWLGRRDRAVAGRGAVAELLLAGDIVTEMLLAGALQRRSIGKLLLVGAQWRRAIGKRLGIRSGAGGRGGAGVGDEVLRCNLNLEAADARTDKDAGMVKGALVNKGGERLLHPDGRAATADIAG